MQYNTTDLLERLVAKNKSYSKAFYIVQCIVTTNIIRNTFEEDEF